jgi:hypothetical protein
MNEPQIHIYELGEFRIDVSKRLLIKGIDEAVSLTPKVFETLLYLVCQGGKVIKKRRSDAPDEFLIKLRKYQKNLQKAGLTFMGQTGFPAI